MENQKFRSQNWFGKKGKDGFIYRAWMKNQGTPPDMFDGRPVIGICNTWSELTPCNGHFKELAEAVKIRKKEGKKIPHLAAILVGNDGGSMTYVGAKVKACNQIGFESTLIQYDESVSEEVPDAEVSAETLKKAMSELNSLIGLDGVKDQIAKLMNMHEANNVREKQSLPRIPVGLHLVFTGSPGTGKTTVARIVAQMYQAIGLLPGGQLVEVDRSSLVAGYVGQTALKVQEAINKARGGVLFIDEAYALSADRGAGFGDEAISTLVKAMEDQRDSLAIIVAGYHEPMQEFIASNQGLKSRFQNTISFADYKTSELLDIFKVIAGNYKITLTEDVLKAVEKYFDEVKPAGDMGNARYVRNLFEKMYLNLSSRAAVDGNIELHELVEFAVEDIPAPDGVKKPTIGF
jgi:ATP-dependent Clp protease ATP-binding subunit ClpA